MKEDHFYNSLLCIEYGKIYVWNTKSGVLDENL